MNLLIDIGNTRLKAALFEGGQMVDAMNVASDNSDALARMLRQQPVERAMFCSSGEVDGQLRQWVEQRYPTDYLSHHTPLPIRSIYHTPATLGNDRVAAVVGASTLYPGQDCLVVDAGTCLTYDIINAQGIYMGGNITPGIGMRLQAMHHYTASLPLLQKQPPLADRGHSTHTAMQAGATWGTVLEIEGFISRFRRQWAGLRVVLTGGDASLIHNMLNGAYDMVSHLLFIGLNKILEHNA